MNIETHLFGLGLLVICCTGIICAAIGFTARRVIDCLCDVCDLLEEDNEEEDNDDCEDTEEDIQEMEG